MSLLLSREYPIAAVFCDEQELAFAERVNGDVTEAPLAGLATVTVAPAGIANADSNRERIGRFLTMFIWSFREP